MMKKKHPEWTRRKFIGTLTGAGTAMMLNPCLSWTINEVDPRVAAIVAKTIGIDTHNHIDVPLNATEQPGPKADLAGEMKQQREFTEDFRYWLAIPAGTERLSEVKIEVLRLGSEDRRRERRARHVWDVL